MRLTSVQHGGEKLAVQRAIIGRLASTALAAGSVTSGAGSHAVDQTWRIHRISHGGGVTIDKGTVTGPPFGPGTVVSRAQAAGSTIQSTFTERFANATVTGKLSIVFTFIGPARVRCSGHRSFTGGTGIYSGASGSIRSFTGANSRSNATIRVTGTVFFHGGSSPPTLSGSATGTVLVNGKRFTSGTIAYGSTVDVTSGTLTLRTDVGTLAVFGDGTDAAKAVLTRTSEHVKRKTQPLVQVALVGGDFRACSARKAAASVPGVDAKKPKPKTVRALWGKALPLSVAPSGLLPTAATEPSRP
jgi:hypothetical protein